MKTPKFYLANAKISKAEALKLITPAMLESAAADYAEDPNREISFYVGRRGFLVIEF